MNVKRKRRKSEGGSGWVSRSSSRYDTVLAVIENFCDIVCSGKVWIISASKVVGDVAISC